MIRLNHKSNIDFFGMTYSSFGNKAFTNDNLTDYCYIESFYFANKLKELADNSIDATLLTLDFTLNSIICDFHRENRHYILVKYKDTLIEEENKLKIAGITCNLEKIVVYKTDNWYETLYTLAIHEVVGCMLQNVRPFQCKICGFYFSGYFRHKICGYCKEEKKNNNKNNAITNKESTKCQQTN